ncbi:MULTISPECIES: hypothetical protein [unclassified Sinorhizobium]|uniref:hypothetical protein n=1 Tax=unclassified Sinorhizobium TaxID=2613772 RepID=UPI00352574AE
MTEVDLPQLHTGVKNIDAVEPIVVTPDTPVGIDSSPGTPAAMPSPDKAAEPTAGEHDALDGGPSALEQPASVQTGTSKSRAATRRSQIPQSPVLLQNHCDLSVQHGSDEELAALEAENRQLKRLLIVSLREENERLKSMLRRFGGS